VLLLLLLLLLLVAAVGVLGPPVAVALGRHQVVRNE